MKNQIKTQAAATGLKVKTSVKAGGVVLLIVTISAAFGLWAPAGAAPVDLGYGPNLFYYLRHDPNFNNFSTFGTISTSGAIIDRFGVGQNFDALAFAADDLGYGPNLLYYLRHDPNLNNFSTFGTISTNGAIIDRFGVGQNVDALTFASPIIVSIDIRPNAIRNCINVRADGKIPVAILSSSAFDATTVDPATVRFGSTGTEAAAVRFALRDVDGDGSLDLLLHFNGRDTGIKCGDTSATLTGTTFV